MKFGQRVSIRSKMKTPEFARGIWNPTRREWRDVVESLIHMSRKYKNNKLVMFKLQLWIVWDLINESEAIIKMKEKLKELEQLKAQGKIDEDQYENDVQNLKTDIESSRFTISALREIIDGMVWRYFDYNRAFMYIVADKQPVDLIVGDKGLVNSLFELADVFINQGDRAILNDISNFLRIGDVTNIKADGTIEFIEVKSSKKRGARFTRQKERMQETVEFFNTGIKELDDHKFVISDSPIKQRNYLKQLKDSILRARKIGYDSILMGNHLIVETVDNVAIIDSSKAIEYFSSKHKSIQERWKKQGDFIINVFSFEKLEYAKNFAPYTIFPFEDNIVADILMGKVWIRYQLNNDEVIRIIEKGGWQLIESVFDITEEEVKNSDIEDLSFYKVRKGSCAIAIPAPWFGRLCFEMISPKVLLDELDRQYEMGPATGDVSLLTRYQDDNNIWN